MVAAFDLKHTPTAFFDPRLPENTADDNPQSETSFCWLKV